MAKKNSAAESGGFSNFGDLKFIGRIASRNWYIPVITTLIAWLIAFFYTYKLIDYYQARAQLLLKSNTEYYSGSVITEKSFYGNTMQTFIDNSNEIRVICSYDLIEETVNRLRSRLEVSYFIPGKVKTVEHFSYLPFQIKVNNINSSFCEKKMQFSIIDTVNYKISFPGQDGKIETLTGFFGTELVDINFNFLITKSPALNSIVKTGIVKAPYEFQVHSIDNLVKKFQGSLSAENPNYTNIINVAVEDIIPERAVLFLDSLIVVYQENALKLKREINSKTLMYIKMQMDTINDTLRKYEDAMQGYKETKNILGDLNREEASYFTKLNEFDHKKTQLSMQLKAMEDMENYIMEDKDPQFLPPSIFLIRDDNFLSKSVDELYQKQLALNSILLSAQPANPNYQTIKNSIKKQKIDLLVYLSNSKKATNLAIENVTAEMNTYISNIKSIPEKERDLLSIKRMVDVNQGLYTFLLQRRANTGISSVGIVSETKVLESPRAAGVVRPDKKKISMNFLLGGAMAGLVIVLIRAIFFSRIESFEELKEKTSLPVVGEVSEVKNLDTKGIIVETEPRSAAAEAFRSIRTNIQYLNPQPGSKVILITSNAPGEGKTFTTINLAAILAKASKRTLILELDMHKPRVQRALEMSPDKGISSVIIGKDSIEDSIVPTVVENLFVMLSGPIPPNPSDLILSKELASIIEYGKTHFDYVIIDTPPAGLISDALFLMHFADINLFVVNPKFATTKTIRATEEMVRINEIKNFTFLMNGVKRKKLRYYYSKYGGYGRGYGYGYGYGYGSGYGGYNRKS